MQRHDFPYESAVVGLLAVLMTRTEGFLLGIIQRMPSAAEEFHRRSISMREFEQARSLSRMRNPLQKALNL